MLCHFLIGTPSSGKSTLAAQLAQLEPGTIIISTDKIREQLYTDETIQGNWLEIEAEVIQQIKKAIANQQPVIYDATNAKRAWRMAMLQKLAHLTPTSENTPTNPSSHLQWMAWYLKTPLKLCKQWNKQRSRQVPEEVIDAMAKSLKNFPPLSAEGFVVINQISPDQDFLDLRSIMGKIERRRLNRHNRTHNTKITLHQYSRLLDFDRLMHLIALILRYPGIGNLHNTNPQILEEIFGKVPPFPTSEAEICAVISSLCGSIYGDEKAISADLKWLEAHGILSNGSLDTEIERHLDTENFVTHPYSEIEPFTRIIKTIRFILHHPFLRNPDGNAQENLVQEMLCRGVINYNCLESLQKDIQRVHKPFQILPSHPLKQGYFAGTAIFSSYELQQLFDKLIHPLSKQLSDPLALQVYEQAKFRLNASKLVNTKDAYPVRTIGTHSIVNMEKLPQSALAKNLEKLETAIENGELLELNRLPGGGRFTGDKEDFFLAYPLQLVFHNIAWYLGYEIMIEEEDKLLRFERLDRLFFGRPTRQQRSRAAQQKALQKLTKLYHASAGIHLGNSIAHQRRYLSPTKSERAEVEILVELWFTDGIFRFISEGTQRFPRSQMQMSPPTQGMVAKQDKSLFALKPTKNKHFPHRFQVRLPCWSMDDVELKRWIVGFGGGVMVVKPAVLRDRIRRMGKEISGVYD